MINIRDIYMYVVIFMLSMYDMLLVHNATFAIHVYIPSRLWYGILIHISTLYWNNEHFLACQGPHQILSLFLHWTRSIVMAWYVLNGSFVFYKFSRNFKLYDWRGYVFHINLYTYCVCANCDHGSSRSLEFQ